MEETCLSHNSVNLSFVLIKYQKVTECSVVHPFLVRNQLKCSYSHFESFSILVCGDMILKLDNSC